MPVIPCVVYVTAATWSVDLNSLWTGNLKDSRCTLKFFDDAAILSSAKDLNVSWALESLKPWAYKIDVWRYAILYERGGIFFDAESKLFKPPEAIFDLEKNALQVPLDRNPLCFYNAIMAAPPGSDALKLTLRQVVQNIKSRSYGHGDATTTRSKEPWLAITGPCTLGAALLNKNHLFQSVGRHIAPHTLNNGNEFIVTKDEHIKSEFSKAHYGAFFGAHDVYVTRK